MPTHNMAKAGSGRAGNHVKDKAASLRTRTYTARARKVYLEQNGRHLQTQRMKTALVKQLSSPCVEHPRESGRPAWWEISKPLLSWHVAPQPPSEEASTHSHFVSNELICKQRVNPIVHTHSRSVTSQLRFKTLSISTQHTAPHAEVNGCKHDYS